MKYAIFLLVLVMACSAKGQDKRSPILKDMENLSAKGAFEMVISKGNTCPEEVTKDYADCLDLIALAYFQLHKYQKADSVYQECLLIHEQVMGRDTNYAITLNNRAFVNATMGAYQVADSLYQENLLLLDSLVGSDHPLHATTLNNLGELSSFLGLYIKAEQLYLRCKQIREKTLPSDDPTIGRVLNNLAVNHHNLGTFGECESYYKKVLKFKKIINDTNSVSYYKTVNNLGALYRILGYYDAARLKISEVHSFLKKDGTSTGQLYIHAQNNLAAIEYNLGNYEKAKSIFEEALRATRETYKETHVEYARALNNLGKTEALLGEHKRAEALYKENLQVLNEVFGKEHHYHAKTYQNLGLLYQALRNYEMAENYYKESVRVSKKVQRDNHIDHAGYLMNLSNLYLEIGLLQQVEPLYETALKIYSQNGWLEHPDYAALMINLGYYYEITGNLARANSAYLTGTNILQKHLRDYYIVLSEQERLNFLRFNVEPSFHRAYSYFLRNSRKSRNLAVSMLDLHLSNKGLGLLTGIKIRKIIRESEEPSLQRTLDQWLKLRRQIYVASTSKLGQGKSQESDFRTWNFKADSLERTFGRKSKLLVDNFNTSNYNFENLRSNLNQGEVAISFVKFKYQKGMLPTDTTLYAALIVKPNTSYPEMVEICQEHELKSYIRYHAVNDKSTYITDPVVSNELFEILWSPLMPYLDSAETIHYAPSGLLNQIALSSLVDSNGRSMSEKFRLQQYSTLKDFIEVGRTYRERSIVAIGGANFDMSLDSSTGEQDQLISENYHPNLLNFIDSWQRLPGTNNEVQQITKQFKEAGWDATALTEGSAQERNVRAVSRMSPRILHIATHGFSSPYVENEQEFLAGNQLFLANSSLERQPQVRTGLVFSGANYASKPRGLISRHNDGILTAYEIINLDFSNTELVVLSACNSAQGDIISGEGVFNLQRAFKQAGADKLIISLWEIDDSHTAEFMKTFYQHYLRFDNISDAFTKTRSEMASKFKPYYWAAFVLIE